MKTNINNAYKLSRDYKRLKDLADKGYVVVCFVDCRRIIGDIKITHRDVCTLSYIHFGDYQKNDHYSFDVRGHDYGNFYPDNDLWYETFNELCEDLNIEFIDIDI